MSLAQGELVRAAPPKRHRLRRTTLVVLAGTLVLAIGAAALAGYLWLRSYDPLTWWDGTFGMPTGSLEYVIVEDGVHDPVFYVSAEEPGTFSVGFDVTNTGRLPVEVQGLALGGELSGLRMGRAGTWVDSSREGFDRAIVPFEPVTIDPGDGRYLVLQFRITEETACGPMYAPGTARGFSDVSLRYRYVGGFEKTATVQPPFTVVLTCGKLPAESQA